MSGVSPHDPFMRLALAQAALAQAAGEVPVGAIVVLEGGVVGRGYNHPIGTSDPTAHAEILALREAGQVLGSWRLAGATLYGTLEPCCMCAGACVNARIGRLVFGVRDPKAGAAGSVYDLVRSPWLNHRTQVTAGVLAPEIQALMRTFFARLRQADS